MTALTIEQKKMQYSRQLYAYTQSQCNAVRNRTGASKAGSNGHRSSPTEAGKETSSEEDLRTPKPDKNGQLQIGVGTPAATSFNKSVYRTRKARQQSVETAVIDSFESAPRRRMPLKSGAVSPPPRLDGPRADLLVPSCLHWNEPRTTNHEPR